MKIITYNVPHDKPAKVFNKSGELVGEVSGQELKLHGNWKPIYNEEGEVVEFNIK